MRPAAAFGCAPSAQPLAGAMLTVGNSEWLGGGSLGSGPVPAPTVNCAVSPQPPTSNAAATRASALATDRPWDRDIGILRR